MRTEIFIENSRLDISADTPALLTFAIDEVQDFSSRSTTWSKTIVLPGTDNNNQLFGHIFQIGNANDHNDAIANVGYNFNAAKSAAVIIFQDNIQTFKGVLRLMQINIDKGRYEYEVSVFGDLAGLNSKLSGGLLEDLDFSAYDQNYTAANIIASWDNTPGSGIYYPLIDYGTYSTGKHDWDIRTFRPSLYAKEYIDKMFAAAGYRYACTLFSTSRFKGLIVPHSQKQLQRLTSPWFQTSDYGNDGDFIDYSDTRFILGAHFTYDFRTDGSFTQDGTIHTDMTYIGVSPVNFNVYMVINGYYQNEFGNTFIHIIKNFDTSAVYIHSEVLPSSNTLTPYSITVSLTNVGLVNGDTIEVVLAQDNPGGSGRYLSITTAFFTLTGEATTYTPVAIGDIMQANDTIPKNVRQIDFLVSIVKLFNLYVYEDKFDNYLIKIAPYVDFYTPDSSNANDWTYKLDRNGVIQIKPLSELNSKLYKFNYLSDSDFYNDLYNKRYGQVYGGYIFDSAFEFADQENSLELIFSPTVLVGYEGEDKIYSTIFKRTGEDSTPVEENTDSNIRLLQTKKVTGVSSWDLKDGATVLSGHTVYPYAGHLNDPDAPSNDINFGALQQLFFTLASGDLSKTQFNLYWSSYMAEITDKDSKLLTASFYLTPKDIFNLDFSKYIQVDGVLFRLNKIIDYNASVPSECKVELLKVIHTKY